MKNCWMLLAAALLLAPPAARAELPRHVEFGDFYGGVGVGAVIPQSTKVDISGSVTGAGDINFKSDVAVMGMGGYHFNKYLSGEIEIGYASVDYDDISGTLTAGNLGTGSGSIGVDGSASAILGLFNGIVTPWGAKGFSPYFGVGVGFAATETKVNRLTFQGNTETVNSKHSETFFAMDALAGANYSITDKLSLGGRYQYLWIDSGNTSSGGGVTGREGDFNAHVITAQLTYSF